MKSRRLLDGLTILGAALLILAAIRDRNVRAYNLTGTAFATPGATFLVNPSFIDPEAGSAQDQIAAITAAAQTWRNQGRSNFEFGFGGTTAISAVAPDGANTLRYSNTDGNGALAVCFWWDVGGQTTDFDIVFYDRDGNYDFKWAHQNPGPSGEFDIQTVAVHEFGHALGLAHSNVAGASLWPSINPGTTVGRDLHQDDVDGVRALYGALPGPSLTAIVPDHVWIGGGESVTLSGSGFVYVDEVLFDGVAATGIQIIDDQTLSCVPPGGLHGDLIDVEVRDGIDSDTLNASFRYDTARCIGPIVFDQPTIIEIEVPQDGGYPFYGFVSAGLGNIPLASYGDPSDPRVFPLLDDPLFWYSVQNVEYHYPWFGNNYGLLDAQGRAQYQFTMPLVNGAEGLQLHFCFLVGGPGALSGIRTITSVSSGIVTLP